MPRDAGTGIYKYPDGTPGNPGQTIFSTRYNTFINDLTFTLNQPLPVNMGGTGGDSALTARDNLDAEVASQTVTDYDTHVWEAGSFWSNIGANAAPSGNIITGVCTPVAGNPGHMTLEARDNVTGIDYYRIKFTGVWGPWKTNADDRFVNVAGDTMSGDLVINKVNPVLALRKTNDGQQNAVVGFHNSVLRWAAILGGTATESGGGVGSDFAINRYNDVGTFIDAPLAINRQNGAVSLISAFHAPAWWTFDNAHQLAFNWDGGGVTRSVDGTAFTRLWDSTNCTTASAGIASYQKLANGNIIQYGFSNGGSGADYTVVYPIVFPTAALSIVATMAGDDRATVALSVSVENPNPAGFIARPRYISGGTVGIDAHALLWMAWGK